MKIIHIIISLDVGGAELMLQRLVTYRVGNQGRHHMVVSLSDLGVVGQQLREQGIEVIALGMNSVLQLPAVFLRLLRVIRGRKPDIVHTWMYHADLIGGLAGRLAGCKQVIWGIRHSNLSKTENKRSTLWVVRICALLSRYVPAQILSCSVRAKDIHVAVGYEASKLHVIPNGLELDRFVPDAAARAHVRAELGLAPNVPLVGLIARFDSQKNHFGFIEAAALVHAQRPDAHFVMVGMGVDAANTELATAIADKGLQAHMHLLGRRDDVPRLMASLDVLASSSHGEAFPNVLGEAMACGVPCVVTDVGDSALIVGDTGRVVPARDMAGLARGLVDVLYLPPQSKAVLGVQARARVAANYEIGHVARLFEAFYEQVMVTPCVDL